MSQHPYNPTVNPHLPSPLNPSYTHKRPCGFVEAISRFYQRYAQMKGTASRSEYWFVILYLNIVHALLFTCMALTSTSSMIATTSAPGSFDFSYHPTGIALVFYVLFLVFALANLIPTITLSVRRLHDTGHSGGWLWICLLPIAGEISLLILYCTDSKPALWRPEWFR